MTNSGAGGMSVANSGGSNGVVGTSSTSVASSVAAQFGNSFGGASTASKLAAVVAAQQQNNSTPISSAAFDRYVRLKQLLFLPFLCSTPYVHPLVKLQFLHTLLMEEGSLFIFG